jgi:hypothetical protein
MVQRRIKFTWSVQRANPPTNQAILCIIKPQNFRFYCRGKMRNWIFFCLLWGLFREIVLGDMEEVVLKLS